MKDADLPAQAAGRLGRDGLLTLIEHARIDIALQPIVELHNGQALGVEALSRFPGAHEEPGAVFAAARSVGLGPQLEWLAADRARELLPTLTTQYLSINVSPSVALELAAQALALGAPLDRLALEIVEMDALENHRDLRDGLVAAREHGLKITIDDAGVGRSSLHHIAQLHPDIIKIHRSVIHGIAEDAPRRSVVRALVALGDDLGSCVVASGVEEPKDLEVAAALGVSAAQGYLLARPSVRLDLGEWLETRPWKQRLPKRRDIAAAQKRLHKAAAAH